MPVLKNSRYEIFCQNMARGMSIADAWIGAGYSVSSARAHAYRVAAKDSIKQRVVELQTRNIAKQDALQVTVETLLKEAEEARLKAMNERGGAAAAIAALTAKAKLSGKWVERSEQTTKTGDLESLSDDELAAIIRQGQPETPPNPGAKKLN